MLQVADYGKNGVDLVSREDNRETSASPMTAKVLELPRSMKNFDEEKTYGAQGLIDRRSRELPLILEVHQILMDEFAVDLADRIGAVDQESSGAGDVRLDRCRAIATNSEYFTQSVESSFHGDLLSRR